MMKGQLGQLMQQAQQLQQDMQKAQEELAELEVTGEAGGGLVKLTMTGRHEVRGVSIDPSLFEDDDREMIEDLVTAAANDAVNKVTETVQERFSGMANALGLPGGMQLPM